MGNYNMSKPASEKKPYNNYSQIGAISTRWKIKLQLRKSNELATRLRHWLAEHDLYPPLSFQNSSSLQSMDHLGNKEPFLDLVLWQ